MRATHTYISACPGQVIIVPGITQSMGLHTEESVGGVRQMAANYLQQKETICCHGIAQICVICCHQIKPQANYPKANYPQANYNYCKAFRSQLAVIELRKMQ